MDPDGRSTEAYELTDSGYRLAATLSGAEPVSLPPFFDLPIVPDSLWPSDVSSRPTV